ncbi:hypothetical protein SPHINGO8BC_10027 [Sphingobacterium multivorum]|uniref:Uncharacterized protein n=1 Tax=Sphingobacterium multivorum TaxID=28454 RepID=A0A653XJ67_SPHMU|nr:hypothetical protein SPHINGO8BC_10027 [Sphingobacterium multivorum]
MNVINLFTDEAILQLHGAPVRLYNTLYIPMSIYNACHIKT